jgi:zinc transporter ZupT
MDPLQLVGFGGAILILIAYVAHQMKRIDPSAPLYNLLNAVGAGILTYIAFRPFQIGFVVLEGTWTVVSLVALFRSLRGNANPV